MRANVSNPYTSITGVTAVDITPASATTPVPAVVTVTEDNKGKWLGAGIGIGIAIMVFVVLVVGGIWFLVQRKESQSVQPKAMSA